MKKLHFLASIIFVVMCFAMFPFGVYSANLSNSNFNGHLSLNGLPEGYKQILYIESTGTQYIDTGLIADENTRVVIDFQLTDKSASFIFGARKSVFLNAFAFNISGDNFVSSYGNSQNVTIAPADLNRHVVDKNKETVYFDNSPTSLTTTGDVAYTTNLELFASSDADTSGVKPCKAKVYSCKIYSNDVLVRYFIPCINLSGKACLYDIINYVPYLNQGTDDFLAGDVL